MIWWADPTAASRYEVNRLAPDESLRAAVVRSDKALLDWKVSRALLQHVRSALPPAAATSLSHSGGHAICATAPSGWKIGVDLEAIRPRNVGGLAHWVCSPAERDALAALQGDARLIHFYRLWTLKEAFIKAAGLDFPADMASVGLYPCQGGTKLRSPQGLWEGCSYRIGADWIASIVWQTPPESGVDAVDPRWTAAAACRVPVPERLGRWQSDSI